MKFQLVRQTPHGHIVRQGTTLIVCPSGRLRRLFPNIVWHEYTQWDINLLVGELEIAASGYYDRFRTAAFQRVVKPIPECIAR